MNYILLAKIYELINKMSEKQLNNLYEFLNSMINSEEQPEIQGKIEATKEAEPKIEKQEIANKWMLPKSEPVVLSKTNTKIETSCEPQTPNKQVYNVEEVMTMLGIGRNSIYEYLKDAPFPIIRLKGKIRIPIKTFDEWLNTQR